MKLQYYKTNKGIFLKDPDSCYSRNSTEIIKKDGVRLNGKPFEYVYRFGFFFLEGIHEITSYETLIKKRDVLTGYKIKDTIPDELKKSLKEFYTPEEIPKEWDENEDDYIFINKNIRLLSHLYEDVYEPIDSYWEFANIEHIILGELQLGDFSIPERIEVKLHSTSLSKYSIVDLSSIVTYGDLIKMIVPEFCLHTQPCLLSRDQVYNIIRAHVKDNINPLVAKIKSDFDFCFVVSKRVQIKPYLNKYEITKSNRKSYNLPRFKQSTVTENSHVIFEMAPRAYQKYPIIEQWRANNLQELKDQMTLYLETLMAEINSEVSECSCCNGTGYLIKRIDTNDRGH